MIILKQHIARQGKKLSRWFEPLSLFSRDFSVLRLSHLIIERAKGGLKIR
jgi:hypothetical protein